MTADEAREDRRLKCIHLFDGECTRMRCYDKKSPNPHKQPGRAASD